MKADAPLTIAAPSLLEFGRDCLVAAGMNEDNASSVARALVWADLRGVGSHGVARLPSYVRWLEAGDMNPRPAIRTVSDTPVLAILDADRAAGPIAMNAARDAAMERAKGAGVGIAFVRATTHTAALGHYTEAAANAGFVAIACAASGPIMAYHGARAAGVSTSPLSIAAPGGAFGPIVFDMGTGVVAFGRLAQAKLKGNPLPAGWALDGQGNPTTDPALAAIPLPLGGPKGSGLALMIEIVTSLLASNPILADALEGNEAGRRHRQNGLFIALDIRRFCDPDWFAAEAERLARALKALPADQPILLPGERGALESARRARQGIALPPGVVSELRALADRKGVGAEIFAMRDRSSSLDRAP